MSGKLGAVNTNTEILLVSDVDDTPANGATTDPVSSNWAYDHVAAADPHTGYRLESADHSHQSTGLQAGKLDHGLALDGLTDDDHTQYILVDGSRAFTGDVTLGAGAKVTKELRIESIAVTHGASPPVDTSRAVGASGAVLLAVDQFSKTTQNDTYFMFHAPSDIDDSVSAYFHLMWLPGAAWTAGNYVWKVEYLIKSEGDSYATGTPTTISADVTPPNATNIIETEFVTGVDLNTEQTMWCHFYRDVANDNGDDTGDVFMYELFYTANKLGVAT